MNKLIMGIGAVIFGIGLAEKNKPENKAENRLTPEPEERISGSPHATTEPEIDNEPPENTNTSNDGSNNVDDMDTTQEPT